MLTSQNAPHHNCGWRIEQEWALIQSTMLVRLTVLKEVNTVEACMVYPQNAFDNWTSDFPSTQLCYKFTIRQQGAGVPATRCSIQRWPASCTYLFVTLVVHKKQQRITMACSKFVRTWTSCHVIRRPSDLKAHLSMRLRLTTLSSKVSARCLMLSLLWKWVQSVHKEKKLWERSSLIRIFIFSRTQLSWLQDSAYLHLNFFRFPIEGDSAPAWHEPCSCWHQCGIL